MKLIARKTINHDTPAWEVCISSEVTGKRVRIYRPTEREALAAANQYIEEHRQHGGEMATLSREERAFILKMRKEGVSIDDLKKATKKTVRGPVSLLWALNEYLRTQEGNSKSHTQSLKNYYTRFSREFPKRGVAEITSADVANYLFAHRTNARGIYSRLRQFFRWCVMMDYIERHPVERVPTPDPDNKERQVFTSDQMRALLKAAENTPVVLRYLVRAVFSAWPFRGRKAPVRGHRSGARRNPRPQHENLQEGVAGALRQRLARCDSQRARMAGSAETPGNRARD